MTREVCCRQRRLLDGFVEEEKLHKKVLLLFSPGLGPGPAVCRKRGIEMGGTQGRERVRPQSRGSLLEFFGFLVLSGFVPPSRH